MAFKVEDGAPAWHFDLIPTGDQTGADTWQTPGAAQHGGGAAWTAYALDRDTGTIFLPVGNPGPDYQSGHAPGANLFTISVVALDARTGKLKWWYQLRANDDHDWDATNVSLFDSRWPEAAWRLQASRASCTSSIARPAARASSCPVTTVLNQDAPLTPEGVRVCPVAGVQWNGAAHSPKTGLLYVNAIDWCTVFKLGPEPKWEATVPYTGLANGWGTNDPTSEWAGWINAVDPATGKMAWRVKTPSPMYAAITPTAGDVLFTGDLEGDFARARCAQRQGAVSIQHRRPDRRRVSPPTSRRGAVRRGRDRPQRRLDPVSGSATIVVFAY